MLRYAMRCYAMQCYAMLRYAMLRYAIYMASPTYCGEHAPATAPYNVRKKCVPGRGGFVAEEARVFLIPKRQGIAHRAREHTGRVVAVPSHAF